MNAPTTINASPSTDSPRLSAGESGTLGDGRWIIAPGWQERWRACGPIDWFDLGNDRRAEVVKANPNRQVWRMRLGDELVYVKVYRPAGWDDRFRCVVRGGPPTLAEWRAGSYAEKHGVPCVGFLACGLFKGPLGASAGVLVTKGAEGAVPLGEAWLQIQEIDNAPERRRAALALVDAVADLLARTHEARFLHRDAHAGNVLVRGAGTVSPGALHTDLYGATYGVDPSDGEAAWSIAQLNQWFQRQASRSTRLRFLRSYLARRVGRDGTTTRQTLHKWARLVERAALLNADRLYRKRDRRMGRQRKYFATLNVPGGWRATVVLRLRNRKEFPRSVHPDRTPDQWRRILSGLVRPAGEGAAPDNTRCLTNRAGNWWERLCWGVAGSAARRAFVGGHRLRHRDIPCVCPMAVVERRWGPLCSASVLLMERPAHTSVLTDLIDGRGAHAASWAERRWREQALESVGRLLAETALKGVRWPTLQPCSIDIESRPAGGRPRALFGNLDARITLATPWKPDVRQMTDNALRIAKSLDRGATGGVADGGALLRAFRRRLGSAFRARPGWPDDV